jgi:hypothetical protein
MGHLFSAPAVSVKHEEFKGEPENLPLFPGASPILWRKLREGKVRFPMSVEFKVDTFNFRGEIDRYGHITWKLTNAPKKDDKTLADLVRRYISLYEETPAIQSFTLVTDNGCSTLYMLHETANNVSLYPFMGLYTSFDSLKNGLFRVSVTLRGRKAPG